MPERVHLPRAAPAIHRSLIAFSTLTDEVAVEAGLDRLLIELLKIRISQLNGCTFCLRLHTRDALAAGESTDRLAVLSAWADSGYFSPEERAALTLAESITRISTDALGDAAYAAVAAVLDPARLAAVSWITVSMNALNRVAISSRYPARTASRR